MKLKVKYLGSSEDQVNYGGHGYDDPRELLKIGSTYTLIKRKECFWHTYYHLQEFPDKVFNSVCFEEA